MDKKFKLKASGRNIQVSSLDKDFSGRSSPAKSIAGPRQIRSLSRKSRTRLRTCLGRLVFEPGRFFSVTLTFPETISSMDEANRHLDVLGKRFLRAFPEGGFLWRVEPSERMIHFHLVLYQGGASQTSTALQGWFFDAWKAILAAKNCDYRRLVRVGPLDSLDDFLSASEYLAKAEEGQYRWNRTNERLHQTMKRRWGCVGRDNLPLTEVREWVVSEDDLERIKAVVVEKHLEPTKEAYLAHLPEGRRSWKRQARTRYRKNFEMTQDFNLNLPGNVVEAVLAWLDGDRHF